MNFLSQVPFFRFLLPFVIGIVLAIATNTTVASSVYLLWAFYAVLALMVMFRWGGQYRWRWVAGLWINLVLLLAGFQLTTNHSDEPHPLYFSKNTQGIMVGEVLEPLEEKARSYKAVVEVVAIQSNAQWYGTKGKAMVYFEKDSAISAVQPGDRLLIQPRFEEVDGPANPGQFDYQQYLAFHLIHQQTYLRSGSWEILSQRGNTLLQYAYRWRESLYQLFQRCGLTGDELSVAAALVLGYRDKLDESLVRSYSKAGGMHVLAVSGLHVGILFLVLNQLLFFLKRWRYGRVVKAIMLLLILWCYALLTGLSPSVMRATLMFSFIVVGTALSRPVNVYNSIAASAFVLLVLNPYLLMEVGFQLSYLAVIGIVYLQPKMYRMLYVKNKWLDKLWALTTVSVAAQIATFPVTLYYFHQFPNYFLLTNFIVIPAAALILYLGILLFVTASIPVVGDVVAWLLEKVVMALNYCIQWVEGLPHAISHGISIHWIECILIYGAIVMLLWYLTQRVGWRLQLTLALVLVVLVFQLMESDAQLQQRKFIVYSIPHQSAINFIDGNDNMLFSDISPVEKEEKIKFHMQNNWFQLGVTNEKFIPIEHMERKYMLTNMAILSNQRLFLKGHFIQFYQKRVFVVDDNYVPFENTKKMEVDYIVLTQNAAVRIPELMRQFNFQLIIIDSSNSSYRYQRWMKEAMVYKAPIYNVLEQGAFQVNI